MLRTYVKLKNNYGFEKYLDIVNEPKHGKYITKFEISSHKPKVETGRLTKPITPLTDQICNKCNKNEVHDVVNLFNNCT